MKVNSEPINLKHFISKQMRMSHIYQPVMIKALLQSDGEATTEKIAKALLAYDQSQVEYYSLRTKAMVGKVLTNNGVVEPIKSGRQITGYRLTEATHQVTNYTINHDIKNERNSHHGKVIGNIAGYEEPVVVEYHTPIHIDPSSQYLDRKTKFTKWLELSGNNLSE